MTVRNILAIIAASVAISIPGLGSLWMFALGAVFLWGASDGWWMKEEDSQAAVLPEKTTIDVEIVTVTGDTIEKVNSLAELKSICEEDDSLVGMHITFDHVGDDGVFHQDLFFAVVLREEEEDAEEGEHP